MNANDDRSSIAGTSDINRVSPVWMAVLVEGLLGLLGILIAWLGCFDHDQPLIDVSKKWLTTSVGWRWLGLGCLAAMPMIAVHGWIDKRQPRFYQPMQQLVRGFFYPMFAQSSWVELAVISIAAGCGEELLFRWCLQGGIQHASAMYFSPAIALGCGLVIASGLFGAAHCINPTYFWMAVIAGFYLGAIMVVCDSFAVAAIAHAIFDFYALIKIKYSSPEALTA